MGYPHAASAGLFTTNGHQCLCERGSNKYVCIWLGIHSAYTMVGLLYINCKNACNITKWRSSMECEVYMYYVKLFFRLGHLPIFLEIAKCIIFFLSLSHSTLYLFFPYPNSARPPETCHKILQLWDFQATSYMAGIQICSLGDQSKIKKLQRSSRQARGPAPHRTEQSLQGSLYN